MTDSPIPERTMKIADAIRAIAELEELLNRLKALRITFSEELAAAHESGLREGLEQAAKVCQERADAYVGVNAITSHEALQCVAAIRAALEEREKK